MLGDSTMQQLYKNALCSIVRALMHRSHAGSVEQARSLVRSSLSRIRYEGGVECGKWKARLPLVEQTLRAAGW